MKNILTLALFAAISTSALATKPKPVPTPTPAAGSSAVSAAQASAIAAAVALAVQQQTQVQGQQQQALGGNAHSTSGGNTLASSVNVAAQERDPVSTAYAPALAAHNCLGSTSGGAQGAAFGFSIGSTKLDPDCNARADADALSRMGKPRAALARLCQREDIARAIEASGEQCPTKPAQPVSAVKTADYTGSDPIVRSRLGLE